jgi:hypothetical protein
MFAHRFLSAAFIVGLFAPHSALALDWEIERNFRYFLYPSDMAAQRVARDLYVVQKGATPTPEQLEHLMNGGGFGGRSLARLAICESGGQSIGRAMTTPPRIKSSDN